MYGILKSKLKTNKMKEIVLKNQENLILGLILITLSILTMISFDVSDTIITQFFTTSVTWGGVKDSIGGW